MTPEQFTAALAALGWKQAEFCRKAGLTDQTPSRWVHGQSPIPKWVGAYLDAMLDLAMLHRKYLAPVPPVSAADPDPGDEPADSPAPPPVPARLAHLFPRDGQA
jgi:transcriptional regulator with XRE-family HTH domain